MRRTVKLNLPIFVSLLASSLLLVIIGIRTRFFDSYNEVVLVIIVGLSINIVAQFVDHVLRSQGEIHRKIPKPQLQSRMQEFSSYIDLPSHLPAPQTRDRRATKKGVPPFCTSPPEAPS